MVSRYVQDGRSIEIQIRSDAQAAPLSGYIVRGAGPDLARRHLVSDLSGAAVRDPISEIPS
jgi:hypothetical protein